MPHTHTTTLNRHDATDYRLEIVQGFLFLHATDPETGTVERAIGMPLPHEKAREIGEMMAGYVEIFEGTKQCQTV